jgi:hypothetical protein
MDIQQLTTVLQNLGLPAAISAVLTVLGKVLSDARQRRSKESLLDWLKEPSVTEPFKDDANALEALHELRQSLIFERAFGLKAESGLRNRLLAFAEASHESTKFEEVLDAGRLVSRYSFARLRSPKQINVLRVVSKVCKPTGYVYIGLGYLWFIGGMYLPKALNWSDSLFWASVTVGLVLGGIGVWTGVYMLKLGRRLEIAARFLASLSATPTVKSP